MFLSLCACYDGIALTTDFSGARYAIVTLVEAIFPFLCTMPLTTLISTHLSKTQKFMAWLTAVPLAVLLYALLLYANNANVVWETVPWPDVSTAGRWTSSASLLAGGLVFTGLGSLV
jgi:hypothetical protein